MIRETVKAVLIALVVFSHSCEDLSDTMPVWTKYIVAWATFGFLLPMGIGGGQTRPPTGGTDAPNAANSQADPNHPAANPGWIVRDPTSGRLYRQHVVSVTVPVTHWETRPRTETVYEPQTVTKNVPAERTVFVPSTTYVMQPRLRGWWNPFRQPIQGYDFVPVTAWQPQTQQVQQPVTEVAWVPRQRVVYTAQPVQKMVTEQRLVQTEISPTSLPGGATIGPLPVTALASNRQPLIRIPILAKQQMLPWPNVQSPSGTGPVRQIVDSGLRPISQSASIAARNITPAVNNYAAPLQTASRNSGRDSSQSGMTATVLR